MSEDVDTKKFLLPKKSTVAMQWKDRRPLMYGTIVLSGSDDHKGKDYQMGVMKTRHTITGMKRCVRAIPISVGDYPRKEMPKVNRPQADDKLNELTDHFALLNQNEHLNNLKKEAKDIILKQPNLHSTYTQTTWEK